MKPVGLLLWVIGMLLGDDVPWVLTRAEVARSVLSDPEMAVALFLAVLVLGAGGVIWLCRIGWNFYKELRDSTPF